MVTHITTVCNATFALQNYTKTVNFLLLPLSNSFDAVLGDTWMSSNNACFDYKQRVCRLSDGNSRDTLHACLVVPKSLSKTFSSSLISVNYRALIKQTKKNRYPLPRIDDLLDQF
jgi:hypothetical protein